MSHISTLDDRRGGRNLILLLTFFLALAFASPTLLAQEWDHWDHMNGRDKVHDPTGAWLVRQPIDFLHREFQLITFHKGGTVTINNQGENGFDPAAVPLPPSDPNYTNNVITSPLHGVWQKIGWNTFAATLLAIEYHISTDPSNFGSPLFIFAKVQFTGTLSASGDRMELNALVTHFDNNGNQTDPNNQGDQFKANGVRVPLEILPNTSHQIPIPPVPQ